MIKTKAQNKVLCSAEHKYFCAPVRNTSTPFFLVIFLMFFLFLLPFKILLAQQPGNYENELVKGTPIIEEGDLVGIIFTVIQYLLSFLGVVAVFMIIYSGFLWMTAAGNEEKVAKAKKILTYAVIGLIIILLAYALTVFIITKI